MTQESQKSGGSVRLDKWLWAARFYKTRSLAKQHIIQGKVRVNGNKVKPSRDVVCGDVVQCQCGWDTVEVRVEVLSEQRRNAQVAATLYTETEESVMLREKMIEQRKLDRLSRVETEGRPSKKNRRDIQRLLKYNDV